MYVRSLFFPIIRKFGSFKIYISIHFILCGYFIFKHLTDDVLKLRHVYVFLIAPLSLKVAMKHWPMHQVHAYRAIFRAE